MRSGNKFFDSNNFRAAVPFYEQVLANSPNNALAYYFAGISYMTFDKERAADYIYRAQEIDPEVDRDLLYWIARIEHINYRFDDAIANFEAYGRTLNRRDKIRLEDVAMRIKHAQNAKREVADPKEVFVKNMGGTINTPYSEHSPVISTDDNYLLFTSRGEPVGTGKTAEDGEYYEAIFESRRTAEGDWEEPRSLAGSLTSDGHDASIQLFDKDTKMLLYRQQNNGDIMYSERDINGVWGPPKSIRNAINSRDSESDAYITKDGKRLFFSTNHFTKGRDLDIYVSHRSPKGEWGSPVSLGNTINSPYDDDSPYLADDGITLYFSSRGHNTMGGYDIFMAVLDTVTKQWSTPVNMGSPVNTPDDDTYYRLSPDGSYAYLSSYRIGGWGEKDIYTISYLRPIQITGNVLAQQDSVPVPGIRVIYSSFTADKRPVSYLDITKEGTGSYKVNVLSGRLFRVQLLKDDQEILSEEFEVPVALKENATLTRNYFLHVGKNGVITKARALPKTYDTYVITGTVLQQREGARRKTPTSNTLIVLEDSKGKAIGETVTNDRGEFTFTVKSLNYYSVVVKNDRYFAARQHISPTPSSLVQIQGNKLNLVLPLVVEEIVVGKNIVIENIYYDFDKDNIRADAAKELDKLAQALIDNPEIDIELSSHTDSRGVDIYNLDLSQRRAESVVRYIISKGVKPNRITAKGYGETKPKVNNARTEREHQLNRRTEFTVIRVRE